jgi:tripartite-type tricarboxylate transporter receptor subunit TctC
VKATASVRSAVRANSRDLANQALGSGRHLAIQLAAALTGISARLVHLDGTAKQLLAALS